MQALITNIQGYSIHDGPGIRTVVFFKGCGLRCAWCANPECISGEPQIGFIASLCTGCGKCAAVCPNGAVRKESDAPHRIDYRLCIVCGACVDACYYGALVKYGKIMNVEEVFEAVRRDKMFYSGGGGVTASGGEPLKHPEFLAELFELCRQDDISTCIETSGFAEPESMARILPYTDHVLFDVKHIDSGLHKKYTGIPNGLILENAKRAIESGADVVFRKPLVPGVNDDAISVELTARFLKTLSGVPRLQLMPFHRMGDSKYKALDMSYAFKDVAAPSKGAIENVRESFARMGVACTVSE